MTIFHTAFLTSLLASAAALTTETASVGIQLNHPINANDLKKETRSRFRSVPTSMSTRIEKDHKLKVKPSSIDLETTTFDETPTHLRGLKMRDNFLSVTSFGFDYQCSTEGMQDGVLINTCMNYEEVEGGAVLQKSYFYKVNKQENLAVEMQYEGFGCQVKKTLLTSCSLSPPAPRSRSQVLPRELPLKYLNCSVVSQTGAGELAKWVRTVNTIAWTILPLTPQPLLMVTMSLEHIHLRCAPQRI
jgi:hypothetical protein